MQSSKQIITNQAFSTRLEFGVFGESFDKQLSNPTKNASVLLGNMLSFLHPINGKTMKKLILIILLSFPFFVSAQSFEAGVTGGAANYLGDLIRNDLVFDFGITRPTVGVFARLNTGNVFSTKAALNFVQIAGDDARSPLPERQARNLSFQNNILEFAIMEEINLFGFNPSEGKAFTPYAFVGIAFYHHNPTTIYQGNRVDLQPLGTEGQGMDGFAAPYALNGIAIPFGGGLKYGITDNFIISLEFAPRKTNADYLDDVSSVYIDYTTLLEGNGKAAADLNYRGYEYYGVEPGELSQPLAPRGNPNRNDWYYTTTISASWKFGGLGGRGNKVGCPTF